MMDSILRFIDQQKATTAVGDRQSDAEQAYRTVPETLERYRSFLFVQPDNRLTFASIRPPIPNHRNTQYVVTEYQFKRPYGLVLIIRQRHIVPNSGHIAIGQYLRSHTFASNLWLRFVIFGYPLIAMEF